MATTLTNNIYNEVDELRGRLSALMVNYPDTEVRLRPVVEVLDVLLVKPLPTVIDEAVDELQDLRMYFSDIQRKIPEMQRPFEQSLALINRLLGPTETVD